VPDGNQIHNLVLRRNTPNQRYEENENSHCRSSDRGNISDATNSDSSSRVICRLEVLCVAIIKVEWTISGLNSMVQLKVKMRQSFVAMWKQFNVEKSISRQKSEIWNNKIDHCCHLFV
jgi:hypothetical protein